MSYESRTFEQLALPRKEKVIHAMLSGLLRHNGVVSEFGSGNQKFSDEVADELGLTANQRSGLMQTIVRKEGRTKTFPAWHRLLYRAAAQAANQGFLSHPSQTFKLTQKKEWMLTERGFDHALKLSEIPLTEKSNLPIKSYEVQKIINKMKQLERKEDYDPIDNSKKVKRVSTESLLRTRGFRQVVIASYDFRCSVCGLKLSSPDSLTWEIEAAHIVPHRYMGKDDVWNGIALCRFHHWAFDVGWFTLRQDLTVEASFKIQDLPVGQGKMGDYDVLRSTMKMNSRMILPQTNSMYPHLNSILWHRQHIFKSQTSL